jgi:hypothetical protein
VMVQLARYFHPPLGAFSAAGRRCSHLGERVGLSGLNEDLSRLQVL